MRGSPPRRTMRCRRVRSAGKTKDRAPTSTTPGDTAWYLQEGSPVHRGVAALRWGPPYRPYRSVTLKLATETGELAYDGTPHEVATQSAFFTRALEPSEGR